MRKESQGSDEPPDLSPHSALPLGSAELVSIFQLIVFGSMDPRLDMFLFTLAALIGAQQQASVSSGKSSDKPSVHHLFSTKTADKVRDDVMSI